MRKSTSDVWVVVLEFRDRYRYDTDMPDEIFLDLAEAEQYCKELNETLMPFRTATSPKYHVVSLYDRIDTIRDEARIQGERQGDDW